MCVCMKMCGCMCHSVHGETWQSWVMVFRPRLETVSYCLSLWTSHLAVGAWGFQVHRLYHWLPFTWVLGALTQVLIHSCQVSISLAPQWGSRTKERVASLRDLLLTGGEHASFFSLQKEYISKLKPFPHICWSSPSSPVWEPCSMASLPAHRRLFSWLVLSGVFLFLFKLKATSLGISKLASENPRCPVKFEFQKNSNR